MLRAPVTIGDPAGERERRKVRCVQFIRGTWRFLVQVDCFSVYTIFESFKYNSIYSKIYSEKEFLQQ